MESVENCVFDLVRTEPFLASDHQEAIAPCVSRAEAGALTTEFLVMNSLFPEITRDHVFPDLELAY